MLKNNYVNSMHDGGQFCEGESLDLRTVSLVPSFLKYKLAETGFEHKTSLSRGLEQGLEVRDRICLKAICWWVPYPGMVELYWGGGWYNFSAMSVLPMVEGGSGKPDERKVRQTKNKSVTAC